MYLYIYIYIHVLYTYIHKSSYMPIWAVVFGRVSGIYSHAHFNLHVFYVHHSELLLLFVSSMSIHVALMLPYICMYTLMCGDVRFHVYIELCSYICISLSVSFCYSGSVSMFLFVFVCLLVFLFLWVYVLGLLQAFTLGSVSTVVFRFIPYFYSWPCVFMYVSLCISTSLTYDV